MIDSNSILKKKKPNRKKEMRINDEEEFHSFWRELHDYQFAIKKDKTEIDK